MLQVEPIHAFDDNYIWLLTAVDSELCTVVDPGDEEPVLAVLAERGLQLEAILITHKHYDHVGGITALKKAYPNAIVYGPANEPIKQLDVTLSEDDVVLLNQASVKFSVMDVPGHTEGHIAYYGHDCLFCGDTLFAGGCGRVFTGTFEQLSGSLQKLSRLPKDTRVYCAHEYTMANLGFARWVEPDSSAVVERQRKAASLREQGRETVPSLLSDELETNPFIRTDKHSVISAAENWSGDQLSDRHQVFTALRKWKDRDYD